MIWRKCFVLKKALIITFSLILSGCSTLFAYKNADWLFYWYLDDYITLTDEQEPELDTYLKSWLAWHKAVELDHYAQHLMDIKADFKNGTITAESIQGHRDTLLSHWQRAKHKVAPDVVAMANTLNQAQVSELFDELQEAEQEKLADLEKRSEAKRKKRFIKRREKGARRWIGKLSTEQKQLIADLYTNQHNTQKFWTEYRLTYQKKLRTLFTSSARGEQFNHTLTQLLLYPEQLRSDSLNEFNEHNSAVNTQFLLAMYHSLSDKQKRHFIEEVDDLLDDISELKKP